MRTTSNLLHANLQLGQYIAIRVMLLPRTAFRPLARQHHYAARPPFRLLAVPQPKLKTELHTSQHRREAGTVAGDEKSGHINTKQNESILFFDSKPFIPATVDIYSRDISRPLPSQVGLPLPAAMAG
jgi:hypothetical protein